MSPDLPSAVVHQSRFGGSPMKTPIQMQPISHYTQMMQEEKQLPTPAPSPEIEKDKAGSNKLLRRRASEKSYQPQSHQRDSTASQDLLASATVQEAKEARRQQVKRVSSRYMKSVSSKSSSGSSMSSTMNSNETMAMANGDGHGAPPVPRKMSWQHRVSASFNAMSEQINMASQAISMIPQINETTLGDIYAKLDAIEKNQKQLAMDMAELKERVDNVASGPENLEKKLNDQITAFNTEQLRLPARLHNATCQKSPMLIKAVPISPGKVPKNFPATKGEYEHLTKERYEAIMAEYGMSPTGDTHAKREALRGFLGLPCDESSGHYKMQKQ